MPCNTAFFRKICDAPVEGPKFSVLPKLLCMKRCLPPLHNCSEIDDIVLPIKTKLIGSQNGIAHNDFVTNVNGFSVRPTIYFVVQPFLLTAIPLRMFCSMVTCGGDAHVMHCKPHKLSRAVFFALKANILMAEWGLQAESHKHPIYGKQKETHELIFLKWTADQELVFRLDRGLMSG